MISMHLLRVWVSGPLTCVLGPDSNWRKPPEGNRGRDGMSVPWKFCSDAVLSGKMLVECYLAEDSCMRDKESERKGRGGVGILGSTHEGRRRRWWPEPPPPRSTLRRHLRPCGRRCQREGSRICTLLLCRFGKGWVESSGSQCCEAQGRHGGLHVTEHPARHITTECRGSS